MDHWLSSECGLSILELTQRRSVLKVTGLRGEARRVFGSWGRALKNGLLDSQE